MQTVAMDEARLTILMIAGGLFAVAGILLMFRAKQEGSSARLELLGQKFEASSAGIVVFLIGSAFLATPMFVQERPRVKVPTSSTSPVSGEYPVTEAKPADTSGLLPPPVNKDEAEGNDSITTATILDVGQTARGEAKLGDIDWYAVAVDASVGKELRVVLRRVGGHCPRLTILDGAEKVVKDADACEISTVVDVPIQSDKYFVQVNPQYRDLAYELAISYGQ